MNPRDTRIIILTGLSGSGKSTALAALEDAGFFCVDNLPVALLPQFLELHLSTLSEVTRFAFVMDLREKGFLNRYGEIFKALKEKGFALEIVFLEAGEDALVRRYSETRRHHPLSTGRGLLQSIRAEKDELKGVRGIADRVINTTRYNVHELKALFRDWAEKDAVIRKMEINVISFGFKYGAPQDADLVMDVRFLPNPYFIPELKLLSGEDEPVRKFVMDREETRTFLNKFIDLLDFCIPLYEAEGKSYLTVAVGCTGGQHRSVTIAWKVYEHLRRAGKNAALIHRDIRA